jgi:hypothetical protein
MQIRTKKTLTTAALGLAAVACAAGTASAADLTGALGSLPVGQATGLVPGAADSTTGAKQALANGSSALPGDPASLLPSGNHLSGNSVAPVSGLLGGLPAGGGLLGN